jgi:hypothetical protein
MAACIANHHGKVFDEGKVTLFALAAQRAKGSMQ